MASLVSSSGWRSRKGKNGCSGSNSKVWEAQRHVPSKVLYTCEYQHLPVVPDADATDTIECDRKRLWLGDSWFGSVKTVANIGKMGQHACMIIKTAHTRLPKKFLEQKMADFPGGTWIVMEGRAEKEEVDLVCVGYKYNKRKVLTFVLTKGAGKL